MNEIGTCDVQLAWRHVQKCHHLDPRVSQDEGGRKTLIFEKEENGTFDPVLNNPRDRSGM